MVPVGLASGSMISYRPRTRAAGANRGNHHSAGLLRCEVQTGVSTIEDTVNKA